MATVLIAPYKDRVCRLCGEVIPAGEEFLCDADTGIEHLDGCRRPGPESQSVDVKGPRHLAVVPEPEPWPELAEPEPAAGLLFNPDALVRHDEPDDADELGPGDFADDGLERVRRTALRVVDSQRAG